MSDTWNKAFTRAGAKAGDKVKVTVEGTVRQIASGTFVVDLPNYRGWNINEDHVVTVTEKAKPKEPTEPYVMVQGVDEWGTTFRYIRLAPDEWRLLRSYGMDSSVRSWARLLELYDNGNRLKVLKGTFTDLAV